MASISFDLSRTSRDPGWNAAAGLAHDALWQQAVSRVHFTSEGAARLQSLSTIAGTGFTFSSELGDVDFRSLGFAGGGTIGAARATSAPVVSLDWTDDQTAILTLDRAWNTIKNAEVSAFTGTSLTLANWVDAWVHLADDIGRSITLDGSKRGEVTTGAGRDIITIAVESNNAGWTNEFLIQSGGGDDVIRFTATSANRTGGAYAGDWTKTRTEAGDGNDTIIGWGSDDRVDGGAGLDQFHLSGLRAGYAITTREGVTTIRDTNLADGDDGTDTLRNVETLIFGDGSRQVLIIPPPPEGAEIFFAGAGFSGTGYPVFDGGDGYDVFVIAGSSDRYAVLGGTEAYAVLVDLQDWLDGQTARTAVTLLGFERVVYAGNGDYLDLAPGGIGGGI